MDETILFKSYFIYKDRTTVPPCSPYFYRKADLWVNRSIRKGKWTKKIRVEGWSWK